MKVAICIPSTEEWRAEFGMDLAALVAHATRTPAPDGQPIEIKIFNMRFAYLPFSRNVLFREALAWKADWVLHLETDIHFPRDALHRLLSRNVDCVGVNYVQRRCRDPKRIAAEIKRFGSITGLARKCRRQLGLLPEPLVVVEHTPFGLALIRSGALRKVPTPWFNYEGKLDLRNTDCEETLKPNTLTAYVPDDHYFCKKMMAQGYNIYIDMQLSAEVRHVGTAYFGFHGPEYTGVIHTA